LEKRYHQGGENSGVNKRLNSRDNKDKGGKHTKYGSKTPGVAGGGRKDVTLVTQGKKKNKAREKKRERYRGLHHEGGERGWLLGKSVGDTRHGLTRMMETSCKKVKEQKKKKLSHRKGKNWSRKKRASGDAGGKFSIKRTRPGGGAKEKKKSPAK